MSITAYHLHEGGHEVYEIGKPAAGAWHSAISVGVGRFTQRNVLVLGRDLTYHVRQKYPPASNKALAGIVANHMAELFPMLSSPGFAWKVFQRHKNYTLADIWAWDKTLVEDFRAQHGLDYVVPEDMLFSSALPQVTIYGRGLNVFLVAHGPAGFIGAATVAGALTARHMALFMKSLGRMESEIRKVENLIEEVAPPGTRTYPPPIDRLPGFKLSPFRTAPIYASVDMGLVFRAALYAVASYVFAVYLSIWHYDGAITRLKEDTGRMDEKINLMMKSGSGSAAYKQYKKLVRHVRTAPSPFDALEILVLSLPPNSHMGHFAMDGNNVGFFMVTKTPSEAINNIRSNSKVESVEISEPFSRDNQGRYGFRLVFNMKGGS
jgi:hypothetical protein